MWRPQIMVSNVVDKASPHGLNFAIINVQANGLVTWQPSDIVKTLCQMDVTNFPLDEHNCFYKLSVWGLPKHELNLKPVSNSIGLQILITVSGMFLTRRLQELSLIIWDNLFHLYALI